MERYAHERLHNIQERESGRQLAGRKQKEEHVKRDADRWREYHCMHDGFEIESAKARAILREIEQQINEEYTRELRELEQRKQSKEKELEDMWHQLKQKETENEQQLRKKKRELEQEREQDLQREQDLEAEFNVKRDAEKRESELLHHMGKKFQDLDTEHAAQSQHLKDLKVKHERREQFRAQEKAEMARVEREAQAIIESEEFNSTAAKERLNAKKQYRENLVHAANGMRMEKEQYLDDILTNLSPTLRQIKEKSLAAEKFQMEREKKRIQSHKSKGTTSFLPAVLSTPTMSASDLPKPDVTATPWSQEDLRAQFESLDVDGGGFLAVDEIHAACKQLSEEFGVPLTEADFQRLLHGNSLQAIAAPQKMKLDFDDFCMVMLKVAQS